MRECGRGSKGLRAVHSPPLPGHRTRQDGWTDARRKLFLRALSETGSVRDACARAGMASTSAYRLRRRHAAFARAWDLAVRRAAPTIEQAAYERAVLGWEEPIVQGGQVVGTRRRYSDSLLRVLLTQVGTAGNSSPAVRPGSREAVELAHEAARLAGGSFVRKLDSAAVDRALIAKLDALARRAEARGDAGDGADESAGA
jgi:hypothetical protein